MPLFTSDGTSMTDLLDGTIDGCLSTLNFGSRVEENFKACVFELVDLKYNGNDVPPGPDDGVTSPESLKFKYLYASIPAVSFEYRVIVANQFANYILAAKTQILYQYCIFPRMVVGLLNRSALF